MLRSIVGVSLFWLNFLGFKRESGSLLRLVGVLGYFGVFEGVRVFCGDV